MTSQSNNSLKPDQNLSFRSMSDWCFENVNNLSIQKFVEEFKFKEKSKAYTSYINILNSTTFANLRQTEDLIASFKTWKETAAADVFWELFNYSAQKKVTEITYKRSASSILQKYATSEANSMNNALLDQFAEKDLQETELNAEQDNCSRDEVDNLFNPIPSECGNKRKFEEEALENEKQFSNRLSLPAWKFRYDVYALGVKKLNGTLTVLDKENLKHMINIFKANDMGGELDLFSAKLIYDTDEPSLVEANALKLSLSRTVNLMNKDVLKIFKKYILNDSFWEKVNSTTLLKSPGLPSHLKALFNSIISSGSNNDKQINLKQLRLEILREKTAAVNAEDDEKTSFLDIIETVLRSLIVDPRNKAKDDESEMTSYRKIASILDLIFKSSTIELIDGETTCKATKRIAKCQEEIFGDNIPLNRGFGRRIDLLLTSNKTELSTNEWKRKKVTADQCLTQQTKNIRMNKAILSELVELQINETDKKHLYTLSMDWVGPQGYMFAVEKICNIFVATYIETLSMPEYLFQFPNLLNTLDALYCWSNHHNKLEDILLPAVVGQQENSFFSSFNAGADDKSSVCTSPNTYLTPTRSKKQ